jgi:hypothetical protein
MTAAAPESHEVLAATVRVPEHVVHRDFEGETVALNLHTGTYHGLNPTAARMLEVLGEGGTVADELPALCDEFGQPRDVIERDVVELCRALAARDLIELEHAGGG